MLKILGTNWINLLGIFAAVYFDAAVVARIYQPDFNLFQCLVSAAISVCLFGIIFGWDLYSQSFFLDILLFGIAAGENVKARLFIECILISAPMIYWSILYKHCIFIVAVVAFLFTQYLRSRKISSDIIDSVRFQKNVSQI